MFHEQFDDDYHLYSAVFRRTVHKRRAIYFAIKFMLGVAYFRIAIIFRQFLLPKIPHFSSK